MIQTDDLTNLETVPFAMLKPIAISIIKGRCHMAILNKYPYWKQLNIIRLGGNDLDEMSTYIDNLRMESDKLEKAVHSCRSRKAVLEVLNV